MRLRTEFHEILVGVLGTRNVYFQPPPDFKMLYPCIVYNRNTVRTNFADNKTYAAHIRYSVTLIDKNPDSAVVNKLMELPLSSFENHFTTDGLNHDVFNVHY